jgi:hypothetical protein
MRVPQVSERIKEAPAQALRGVFAGIGQLLLVSDKLRNKTPAEAARNRASERAKAAATAEPAASQEPAAEAVVAEQAAVAESAAAAAEPVAAKPARDFDRTGNVRLLAGQEDAAATAAASPAVAAQDVPPLPNYGELSIASLRARLRNLDVTQLKQVADYERSHAGRPEVIAMFERRAAKLEAEAGPEAGA